jgi:dihydrofolate reductase
MNDDTNAEVCIIAAVANNGVIGRDNKLPWDKLEGDLPRFKEMTIGNGNNVVIYGKNTLASMGNKALMGRKNIVLSRDPNFLAPNNVQHFESLQTAIDSCMNDDEKIFLIGGESVFKEGLNIATKMIITETHIDYDGDVYFPKFDESKWDEIERTAFPDYDVITYSRII